MWKSNFIIVILFTYALYDSQVKEWLQVPNTKMSLWGTFSWRYFSYENILRSMYFDVIVFSYKGPVGCFAERVLVSANEDGVGCTKKFVLVDQTSVLAVVIRDSFL